MKLLLVATLMFFIIVVLINMYKENKKRWEDRFKK